MKINYYLKWQRSFPDPIMNINYLDLTEDGLNELILLSLHGVHILQVRIQILHKFRVFM